MDQRGKRKTSRRSNGEGSIVRRKDGRYQGSIMANGMRRYYYSSKRADCVNWLTEIRAKLKEGQPIMYANEEFDPSKPDTFFETV